MSLIQTILILILTALAVTYDVKYRRIPNKLTVPFALAGITLNTIQHGFNGTKESALGFLLGFLVFLIPYAMKAMGAGDVKLMAAIGALSNWKFILYTTLLTAIAGGLLVLVVRLKQGGLGELFKNVGKLLIYAPLALLSKFIMSPRLVEIQHRFKITLSHEAENYIPYGLAIGLGVVTCLALFWSGRITI